jgi:hypothetical protein
MMSFNNLQPQNGDLCDICSTIPLKCFVEDGAKFDHYRSRDDLEKSASNGCPLCFIIQVADEATDTWFPIHERGAIDDLRYWGRSAGPFHLKVEARENENLKLFVSSQGDFPVYETFKGICVDRLPYFGMPVLSGLFVFTQRSTGD